MSTNKISGDAGEMLTKDETIIEFMNRVELTRGQDDVIEASPSVFKHFCPKGGSHFTYKGLIVCEMGKRDELEAAMNMTHEEKMMALKK